MKKKLLIISVFCFGTILTLGQIPAKKDKGVYINKQRGYFYDVMLPSINDKTTSEQKSKPALRFVLDLSDQIFPTQIEDYVTFWHNEPLSQGITGTCWAFASVSFFESEIFRITGNEIKLSEMYYVYYEYVERARQFVRKRGDVYFGQGSESNALLRLMNDYGGVPEYVYDGNPDNLAFYDHRTMFDEMETYLRSVKESGNWNEELVASTIRSILDDCMGPPPDSFIYEGKLFTPLNFLHQLTGLNLLDYYSFISTMSMPYNQKGELIEPDNWWHSDDYYNVSLDDFFNIIIESMNDGYTVCICGDVSEPGHDGFAEVSVIPDFDIPTGYIDEDARELRLVNGSTTDDHCIHIVGYFKDGDDYWFLVKDSGSGAFDGIHKGYRFFHEDFVKLKMMNILIYKEGARKVLDKIIK